MDSLACSDRPEVSALLNGEQCPISTSVVNQIMHILAEQVVSAFIHQSTKASWLCLCSSTTTARTMKGAATKSRNTCIEGTLLADSDPTKGPRPWTAPQIARKATVIATLLTPVVPKRNADQSKKGTIMRTGTIMVEGETKL